MCDWHAPALFPDAGYAGKNHEFRFQPLYAWKKTMKKILWITGLILALSVMAAAQQKSQKTASKSAPSAAVAAPPQQSAAAAVSPDFVIGVEDALSVNVWKDADSSAPQVVVMPDGKITLPLIKDVQAAGLTARQLEASITEKLSQFLKDVPPVTVIILKIESRKVSIVGAVGRPGAYPLVGPLTVLELIARAGGIGEYAKGGGKAIKILRKGSTIDFNYREVIEGKNLKQNIFLENGDVVMVR
jgi:polysaccharide export outer membrane protein